MKLFLAVPQKNNEIEELEKWLDSNEADIYIFPEGFLHTDTLEKGLEIIRKREKFVITGLKKQKADHVLEQALVIDRGNIMGTYTKCILTKGEKQKGKTGGRKIHCINTPYGKIGIPICYEIHFPEVARIMAYESPVLLVNMIGTGMYHALQFEQWTTICKARAIENEVYVVGGSHFCGEIPLAFAYAPDGKVVGECREVYGGITVLVDLSESSVKKIGYFNDRRPELFDRISREN